MGFIRNLFGRKQIKTIARMGDPYVDDCFQLKFKELAESRNWHEIPEAEAVAEAGRASLNFKEDTSRFEEAMRLAEKLRDNYPDFDFPYLWMGNLHIWQKHYESARDVLLEGLRVARSKYDLCSRMGDVEWETHNLASAVKWWTRSVFIQVSVNSLTEHTPFLMLSYVAEELGLSDCMDRLGQLAVRIYGGGVGLTSDEANKLYASTRSQGTNSIKRTLNLLDSKYLSQAHKRQ